MDKKYIFKDKIKSYFSKCLHNDNQYLGLEIEHFLVDKKSLESISYSKKGGQRDILIKMLDLGWEIFSKEGENILGIKKDESTITLEPGGQFEFSIKAYENIEDVKKDYIKILKDVYKVIDNDKDLILIGYHPNTKIEELELLPKERYDMMYNYFKGKGEYCHNMMKGTASLHVSIDYKDENDFIKKFRTANFLTPFLSRLFDSTPIFEKKIYDKNNLRVKIWQNTDIKRSKVVPGSLDKKFSFEDYADYIFNSEPIFIINDGRTLCTKRKTVRELKKEFDFSKKGIEHLLSMVFPDVRLKNYIEIRVADSIKYPYFLSLLSVLKGIFYNKKILEKYYSLSLNYSDRDINMDSFIYNLLEDAKEGLKNKDEAIYIDKLYDLIKNHDSMANYLKKIEKELKNSKALYKGEPVPYLYIPRLFNINDINNFKNMTENMFKIINKTIKLYLEEKEVRDLYKFDKNLEEMIKAPHYYDTYVPMGRFDIFYYGDDYKFCELNADGSSAMNEERELSKILKNTKAVKNLKKYNVKQFELFDSWVDEVEKIFKEYKNNKDEKIKEKNETNIAIVDFLDKTTPVEIEVFKEHFIKKGYNCFIVDPKNIVYKDGELYFEDSKIDIIYRRLVTKDLMERYDQIQDLVKGIISGNTCIIGPIKSQIIHTKKFFQILHNDLFRKYLDEEELEYIDKHIPYTKELKKNKKWDEYITDK